MHLTRIRIRHFRNVESIDWDPAPGLNLIWGDNGQGKTNVLEAVHMALTGRSFRAGREGECLPWNREEDPADPTLLEADLKTARGGRRLRLLLGKHWKRAFADGQWVARLADLWTCGAVVTFTPQAVGLFKGPPAERRRFLDMVLSRLSRPYLGHLQRYHQALRRLNAVLKSGSSPAGARRQAEAYYAQLAEAGAAVMLDRARRIGRSGPAVARRFNRFGGAGTLELIHDHSLGEMPLELTDPSLEPGALAQAYLERLHALHEDNRRLGACAFGVHRDDFSARLDGHDLRRFGSQGQHRLAALTLKLEAADWIEHDIGDTPVLLLDDFGSELDPDRRESVLRGLRGAMQVIITATRPADLGNTVPFDRSMLISRGGFRK